MKIVLLAIIAALALTGCKTTRADVLEMRYSRCDDYGFQRGTDAHATCVMQDEQADVARSARSGAAVQAAGMRMMGLNPPGTTCNYTSGFGSIQQTCY